MAEIFVGGTSQDSTPVTMNLKYANRHGLVAGATGTGKTVTLQILTEQLSEQGVPVFVSDVKGDLSGMCQNGAMQDFLVKRANLVKLPDYIPKKLPVTFWDLFGDQGHPLRTTIEDMGPLLLSQVLELNDTQEGVLTIAYRVAQEQNMPLLDLKDLRALLIHVGEERQTISREYGQVSNASIGSIQRSLLTLESQGGEKFFGEPGLTVQDFMRTTYDGKGFVNVLAADKLMQTPRLYATFLLWLLTELFDTLPEAGDMDKPKLVFFFDEAHLLFNSAPKPLLEKVEQIVKLIRSKGVGVFFVTQSPDDIPEAVLSQLGNKFQHALRAFTPKGQKAVRVAAQTFRANTTFDVEEALTNMGVGEALVSTLEKKGVPGVVQQTMIRPPFSNLGPCELANRKAAMNNDGMSKYDTLVDRESAYEMLKERRIEKEKQAAENAKLIAAEEERAAKEKAKAKTKKKSSRRQSVGEAFTKTVVRTVGSTVAREIGKIILKALRR